MICSFDGDYAFLSNFWPAFVVLDGEMYPTVEHAYQAAKSSDADDRAMVRRFPKPGSAKRAGRRVIMRSDWAEVRLSVMRNLVAQKFDQPLLRNMLVATGDCSLVEGNAWGDIFWGVCNGVGENHLGRILMEIRSKCRLDLTEMLS